MEFFIYNIYLFNFTNIVLKVEPEKLSYSDTDCDTLEYTTTSKNASGPIHKTRVLSGGSGYKKLPKFEDITSTNGNGGFVVPKTNNIGEIKKVNVCLLYTSPSPRD